MSRKRKPRGQGTYTEPDGSVTMIVHADGKRITTNILDLAAKHHETVHASQPRRESIGPSVRTNPIPGQSARNKFDYATGMEHETRGAYEQHLKANNLIELDARDQPRAGTGDNIGTKERKAEALAMLSQVARPATKDTIRGLEANRDGVYAPLPTRPGPQTPRTSEFG